ncbi:MAG: DegV family EDD domain-containing protein, partial [Dehalococcoidia bacterium]|nr:DegV family EDD domain-containing protein [Dehalococcoidia bacterium]
DLEWLYDRLKKKEKLPSTAFASPWETLRVYQEVARHCQSILYIFMSSSLTRGYQAALEAREMARESLPGVRIEVVDSRTVEAGETPIVIEAARAAKEGKDLDNILGLVQDRVAKVINLQAFDTLFYRDKMGRIFKAKPWADSEASCRFKALLEIDASTNGVTRPVTRARTKNQLLRKMVDIVVERAGDKGIHVAIVHANVLEQAEALREMLLSRCQCDELCVSEASPVTAVQTGGGLLSLGFYGNGIRR